MNNLPCNIDEVRKNGVYFHSLSNWLSHICLCLADGLNQLGIPVFSNIEVQVTPSFQLGNAQGMVPNNAALIIVDIQENEIKKGLAFDLGFFHPRILVFSMSDTVGNFYFGDEIICFCTHENKYYRNSGKRFPWAFGISSFMIEESEKNKADKRGNIILKNFRPSANQDIRNCLALIFLPLLEKNIEIDDRVGNDHFERLASYIGCLAYGGYLAVNLRKNDFFANKQECAAGKKITFLKEPVILRWDSWRFWESLTCGCLTFHLDFDKYGFMLPVMPENWKHYIGLNLEDIKGDVERLMDERDKIPEIAENGRTWALAHYSPLATAKRFLGYVTY